jgi:hypothetical protein
MLSVRQSSAIFAAHGSLAWAAPVGSGEQTLGPLPGQTELYNTYTGVSPPFPGNITGATIPTASGPAAPEDNLWQNLLAAEWIIYNFYQHAVGVFNTSSFTALGYPNTTYDRIREIRDNEAGHLNIFYRQISSISIKPGPCEYYFGFENPPAPEAFLAEQVDIGLSSVAFVGALVKEAKTNESRDALTAVAATEQRHNVWALTNVYDVDPFAGTIDTVYPNAQQILQLTTSFIKNGSCPPQNPPYLNPSQDLPTLSFNTNTSSGHPGDNITFAFPKEQPIFEEGKQYYAVYFYGLYNITKPFDTTTGASQVPAEFDEGRGLIYVIIADEPGNPTIESAVAGPLALMQQPLALTKLDS